MTQLDLQQRLARDESWAIALSKNNKILSERIEKLETERDALQQQVKELAAENLLLMDFDWIDFNESGPYEPDDAALEILPTTPATDSVINELMARGVDASINHLIKKFEGTGHIGVPVMVLESLAAQIRQPEEKDHE